MSSNALSPYECEQLLGCTTTERRRWTKDGKLKVSEYKTINKYGRTITYPMYDRECLEALSLETMDRWRSEHEEDLIAKRREAGQKAQESRRQNEELRKEFAIEWKRTLASWYKKGDFALAVSFELAYWTMWLSRWAKEHHRKSRNAIKHSQKYADMEKKFYEMKNEGLKILYKTQNGKLSFYRPEKRDKNINGQIERDYYSLYYLEVNSPAIPEYGFSFHIPYPIAKQFFPPPENLPQVTHEEQMDSLFRFGRNILTEEKIIFTEKEVVEKWQDAYMKLNLLIDGEAKTLESVEV